MTLHLLKGFFNQCWYFSLCSVCCFVSFVNNLIKWRLHYYSYWNIVFLNLSFVPLLTAWQTERRPNNVASERPLYQLLGHLPLIMCSFFKRCLCQTLAVFFFFFLHAWAKCGLLHLKLSELFSPLLFFNKALKGKIRTNWATVCMCFQPLVSNVNKSVFLIQRICSQQWVFWQSKWSDDPLEPLLHCGLSFVFGYSVTYRFVWTAGTVILDYVPQRG